jgi:hypothetical protein
VAFGNGTRSNKHQLEVEEFIEGKPASPLLGLLGGSRPVHGTQCLGQGWKVESLTQ